MQSVRCSKLRLVFPTALSVLLMLTLPGVTRGQESCDTEGEVEIGFQGKTCPFQDYAITLNGAVASGFGTQCISFAQFPNFTNKAWAKLKVNKKYQVTAGQALCITHVNFDVPKGYYLEIDGVRTNTIFKTNGGAIFSGDGTWNVMLRKECECGKLGPGGADTRLHSVNWEAGLGNLSDGRSAQRLGFSEAVLSAAVYTPAVLVYSPPAKSGTEVDVVQDAGGVRQIKAPQAFADVVVINSTTYEVRFYRPADVGSQVGGLYTLSGQPYVTWRISNPEPATTTKLEIAKVENGNTTDKSLYEWDPFINFWTLRAGWTAGSNYTRTETRTVTYATSSSRTETVVVMGGGQVVSKVARTYLDFPWGDELVQEVLDPDAAALTTTYTYYENPSETHRYRKVKTIMFADGSWEKYDYDIFWNVSTILRPFKDQAMATATVANSHATIYGYSNSDNGVFGISDFARIPFDVEEKINGITVRKSRLHRSVPSVDPEPLVATAEAFYQSSNNGVPVTLISQVITTRYHHSATEFFANRVASIVYQDGRKDTFLYEKGNYIPNADPGLSQFLPDANGLAQRQTIVHGTTTLPDGVAFKTTKETAVRDLFGNEVLSESYVYTGTGYERIEWVVSTYDDRAHLLGTRDHKGQLHTAVWTGDKKTSAIDAAGVETTYEYDEFGRVKTSTKKGIAAGSGFPAQPDIVTTITYDVEGRQIAETVASSGLSLTTTRGYDKAGRPIRETDQSGLTTTYSYTNGGRTMTVTRPGGATEISDNYLDGQSKSVTGSAVIARYFDYSVNGDGTSYAQELVGNAALGSPRWTRTTSDWIGREVRVEKPGFTGTSVIESSIYNVLNQLQKRTIMAGTTKLLADTLFEYNELGQPVRVGMDVDANGALTAVSTDRISENDISYEQAASDWFRVTTNRTYLIENNSPPIAQVRRQRLNNFQLNGTVQTVSEVTIIDVVGNATRTTIAIDRAAKKEATTIDAPDSHIDSVSILVNRLLQSSTSITPQSATTYAHDGLGRQIAVSSPAGGTSRTFNSSGQLATTNDGAGTTTLEYYPGSHVSAGRLKSETNAIGKKVYFTYTPRGELLQMWGDTTYPQEYFYDEYGQRTELHTFRGGQNWTSSVWPASTTGTAQVTKWIFQESTGAITQRLDAALKGITYTYDDLGHLKTLVRARGVSTALGYDANTGELRTLTYSDGTPAVSFTYDRGGRQSAITDAAGSRARTFTVAGQLQTEQVTGGILDGVSIAVGHNGFLRRDSQQILHGAEILSSQTYGYDAAARLETITSGTQTATYVYHPSTGQLNTTAFSGGTGIGRTYDSIGRLESITTTPAAGGAQSFAYTYNNLNQRTRVTREDGSYWSYLYNDRGEVIAGKKFWSDNSVVWGAQTEYSFDNIGNRKYARSGGNQLSILRESNYTGNCLNQYSQRSVPGAVDVTGTASTAATVTVNNQATVRKGEYFYKELAVDNSVGPVSQEISVIGARNNFGPGGEDALTEKGGRELVPAVSEAFTYDDDGNLLSDGRWVYAWDAVDRLASMESLLSVPTEAKRRLEFVYDCMGRRIQRKTYIWNTGTSSYQLSATTRFVNDDWNVVVELNESNVAIRSFIWGVDGLLFIKQGGEVHQVSADANENVVMLVNAGTGVTSAAYDYDPFGVQTKSTGEFASSNPFRFSMRYFDSESGLQYYGLRYYRPETGRWISRDPSKESGGLNLYGFINNDGLNAVDYLGLWKREADWTGGWYNYSGTVTAECGDTLTRLADLITGDENDWTALGLTDNVQVGKKVNIGRLLRVFEHKLRYKVVAATERFNAVGFNAPSTLVSPTMTTAINKYFDPKIPFGEPDCLTAVKLVMAKGVIDTLKENEFDELELTEENLPPDKKKGTLGSMFVGDMGWIENYKDYLERHPYGAYKGENVIKVHYDRYWGFIGSRAYRSEAGWERTLRAEYNKGSSNKRTDRIPGFDGEVNFIHVPTLTMRVFDLRKKKM